jgi:hypothetical protein
MNELIKIIDSLEEMIKKNVFDLDYIKKSIKAKKILKNKLRGKNLGQEDKEIIVKAITIIDKVKEISETQKLSIALDKIFKQ